MVARKLVFPSFELPLIKVEGAGKYGLRQGSEATRQRNNEV
jgi:hypothetical protein